MPNFFDWKNAEKVFLVQKTFQEKSRILSRNPRKSKKRQESCQEIRENARNAKNLAKSFKRKANKSEWKQTKTHANFGLISVPILPRLFALPTKLSYSEFQYFVLSYIQYFKEW